MGTLTAHDVSVAPWPPTGVCSHMLLRTAGSAGIVPKASFGMQKVHWKPGTRDQDRFG